MLDNKTMFCYYTFAMKHCFIVLFLQAQAEKPDCTGGGGKTQVRATGKAAAFSRNKNKAPKMTALVETLSPAPAGYGVGTSPGAGRESAVSGESGRR